MHFLFFCESKFNAIYVLKMISGTWPPRLIVQKRIRSVQFVTTFFDVYSFIWLMVRLILTFNASKVVSLLESIMDLAYHFLN